MATADLGQVYLFELVVDKGSVIIIIEQIKIITYPFLSAHQQHLCAPGTHFETPSDSDRDAGTHPYTGKA